MTIKLYLTSMYNAFCPCRQFAVLDCSLRFNGDKWRPSLFLIHLRAERFSRSRTGFCLFIFLIVQNVNLWRHVVLFFLFFSLNFKLKKSCIWGFQPRAFCRAVRSCAAPLMCFLNYPHWIHYLFALLNLLNLAALQWRGKKKWFRGPWGATWDPDLREDVQVLFSPF